MNGEENECTFRFTEEGMEERTEEWKVTDLDQELRVHALDVPGQWIRPVRHFSLFQGWMNG